MTCGMLSVKGSMRCSTPREVFTTKTNMFGEWRTYRREKGEEKYKGEERRKKKKRTSSSLIYEQRSCSSEQIYASRGRGSLIL